MQTATKTGKIFKVMSILIYGNIGITLNGRPAGWRAMLSKENH